MSLQNWCAAWTDQFLEGLGGMVEKEKVHVDTWSVCRSAEIETEPYGCLVVLTRHFVTFTMPSSKSRSLRELAFGITKRNSSPGPPSPTFSEATNASAVRFGPGGPEKIITRSNLKTSIQSLDDVRLNCSACIQRGSKQVLSS